MRTEKGKENAKAARQAYNKENIRTLGTTLRKDEAEAFKALAERNSSTAGAMIKSFIRGALAQEAQGQAGAANSPNGHCTALLSEKNMTRLMHETAFHNPRNYNPDKMLNHILDGYFKFADEIRGE